MRDANISRDLAIFYKSLRDFTPRSIVIEISMQKCKKEGGKIVAERFRRSIRGTRSNFCTKASGKMVGR